MVKKPSEKDEKYIETKTANIKREATATSLILNLDTPLEIILTEDNPNSVKAIFNNLIKELKKGPLKFELEDEKKDDMYFHLCDEYIKQLNTEMETVYNELKDYELLDINEE